MDGGGVAAEGGGEEVVEFGDGPAGAVLDDQPGGELVVGEADVFSYPFLADLAVNTSALSL